MTVILQIIGAVLVLAGFAASQVGWLDARSIPYLVLNIAGAGLLAVLALHDGDWGFLLLEGVWVAVSLISLGRVVRLGSVGRPSRRRQSVASFGSAGVAD
jgi:hypothetical protein